jgi:hypothetical protein
MCLVQIKQAQIKFPLSGFWTVQSSQAQSSLAQSSQAKPSPVQPSQAKPSPAMAMMVNRRLAQHRQDTQV